jgi:hypothetical protein
VAKDMYVNILLSANDLILVQNSEDKLQRSVFTSIKYVQVIILEYQLLKQRLWPL